MQRGEDNSPNKDFDALLLRNVRQTLTLLLLSHLTRDKSPRSRSELLVIRNRKRIDDAGAVESSLDRGPILDVEVDRLDVLEILDGGERFGRGRGASKSADLVACLGEGFGDGEPCVLT